MAAVLKPLKTVDVVNKEVVEQALTQITKQLEIIDETIKNRTDYEIWELFQAQQIEIKNIENSIGNILQYKKMRTSDYHGKVKV